LQPSAGASAEGRPNVLWLTCEDISPDLGCYGDDYAITPHLDKLASQGIRYTNAVGITGVCAVNRSCLITGMYSSTLGTQDMRALVQLPDSIRCFPEYLRAAGYYCTNNSKKDYNFQESAQTWDESSGRAHWKNRQPGQPFFAVFNYTGSHESQIWEQNYRRHAAKLSAAELHDPDAVPLPPFHPDTPEVRRDWANYHDNITALDKWIAARLQELAEAELAEDTIVFFFSDHGAGMPGVKKMVFNGGLQVPLLIRFPKEYRHLSPQSPGVCDRLVSFVDFAPTVLSLCNVKIPDHMQGVTFLGPQNGSPRQYAFAIRDRMAEHYETIRVVRDKRYQYHRNFMPHLPWVRFSSYTFRMPTAKVWLRMHREGRLDDVQDRIFQLKPTEELYDLQADPHTVHNLLEDDPASVAPVVRRMRDALRNWQLQTRDLGLLPEGEIHRRAQQHQVTPYELGRNEAWYPLKRKIQPIAWLAAAGDPAKIDLLQSRLQDDEPVVRWWATIGLTTLGRDARAAEERLQRQLSDKHPLARIAAAEALCRLDRVEQAIPVLIEGLKHPTPYIRLRAMNVLEGLGRRARPAVAAIQDAKMNGPYPAEYMSRMSEYLPAQIEADGF